MLSYSRALAQELKGKDVTVTALCPGPVETGFADRLPVLASRHPSLKD